MPTRTRSRKRASKEASNSSARSTRSYFPGKDPNPTTISLTPFAKKIVKAAEKRNKCSRSDIMEGLARKYGSVLTVADLEELSAQATITEGR